MDKTRPTSLGVDMRHGLVQSREKLCSRSPGFWERASLGSLGSNKRNLGSFHGNELQSSRRMLIGKDGGQNTPDQDSREADSRLETGRQAEANCS